MQCSKPRCFALLSPKTNFLLIQKLQFPTIFNISDHIDLASFTLFRQGMHIVPCGKFHIIGGAPPETFSSEKYDAPEEVGGDRKSFDSPIRK